MPVKSNPTSLFRKLAKGLGFLFLFLILLFLLGPKAEEPNLNTSISFFDTSLKNLDVEIQKHESKFDKIKSDNQARVVWADPKIKEKTDYSVVYLHGFSASHGEGDPIHYEFAKRYGCNLYLSRLHEHGLEEEEPLFDLTAESLLESAKEAIAIGKLLGEKVIVMSCSTGGTLSLYLSSGNPDIYAQILYSPNIELFDSRANLVLKPWGYQLLEFMVGGNRRSFSAAGNVPKYWTTEYRIEAIIGLTSLVESTMIEETFQEINQPLFLAYYYKNEEEQDHVVSVPRMLEMYEQVNTPSELKRKVALPNVDNHVICSKHMSKDLESVKKETYAFAEEILNLKPVAHVFADSLLTIQQ